MPLAAGAAVVACVEFAWVLVAGVVTLGCAGALVTWLRADDDPWTDRPSSCLAAELLSRLCMRADMPAPELVVEPGAAANAWTLGGRIHITSALLNALDEGELEAVLAHELAHLARRDAAVMDICSAPSRILLTFAGAVSPRLKGATRGLLSLGAPLGIPAAMWLLAALTVPPAFVVGWLSRLSMLGMSRAREFAADAAAVALTGRPSALASALRKLDDQGARVARSDLRQVEAVAVLCIVGAPSSRLGRLLRTHPPTAARVKRLEAIERRLQAKRSS